MRLAQAFRTKRLLRIALALVSSPLAWAEPAALAAPIELTPESTVALGMSSDARRVMEWVRRSGDHGGRPFIVIDKRRAHLWLFGADSRLLGQTPVLLGLARGDHTVPGIGDRPMSQIQAHERTTPAGRFVVEPGRNRAGEDIFWIDYDAAVSLHRVRTSNAKERRLERLATPTPSDNRISYGCINVPVAFFNELVSPLLRRTRAVAYLLPETVPLSAVFGAADAALDLR